MSWLHVKCNYFKIISAFVDVRLKQFHFSAWKLAWNYFRGWVSLRIFFNMFNVAEEIL